MDNKRVKECTEKEVIRVEENDIIFFKQALDDAKMYKGRVLRTSDGVLTILPMDVVVSYKWGKGWIDSDAIPHVTKENCRQANDGAHIVMKNGECTSLK